MKPLNPGYDMDLIERFICAHHKVEKPWQFIPFGKMVPAWSVLKPVTLTVETQATRVEFVPTNPVEPQCVAMHLKEESGTTRFLDSPLPKTGQRFLHPITKEPMDVDLDRVYPYSIVTRHIRSNVQWPIGLRLNFYHQGLEFTEQRAEHDRMLSAGGAVRGAYMSVTPTQAVGQDVEMTALQRQPFGCCNEMFAATMGMVNESNLKNGVIEIPAAVCREARLPVYAGQVVIHSEEDLISHMTQLSVGDVRGKLLEAAKQRKLKPISHWYAIPINHVLAWGLHSAEYCAERGVRRYEFWFSPPPVPAAAAAETKEGKKPDDILLYYLVDNITYEYLLEHIRIGWMNKVDCRPLSSIGFELVPLPAPSRAKAPPKVGGSVLIRSTISYMVPPKLTPEQVACFAPALYPDFPSSHEWTRPKQEEQELLLAK